MLRGIRLIVISLFYLGMSSTLISFYGEYYEYHGVEREEQGLSIGGYDSFFLADLVVSYLFEKPRLTSNQQSTA